MLTSIAQIIKDQRRDTNIPLRSVYLDGIRGKKAVVKAMAALQKGVFYQTVDYLEVTDRSFFTSLGINYDAHFN